MDFLTLSQRTQLECAITGTLSSVTTTTSQLARIVQWVNAAWVEIQTRHDDWDWLRSSRLLGQGVGFATVAGQSSYPLGTGAGTVGVEADDFGTWDRETFRVNTTSVGYQDETFLDWIPYDSWRDAYMFGAMRSVQTRPVAIAIGPGQSLCLGPPPNALYTVTGDYFRAPSEMVEDTDVPTGLPQQFHMLIVYLAMTKVASYEAAPELLQRGESEFRKLMARLEALRVPEIVMGGSL